MTLDHLKALYAQHGLTRCFNALKAHARNAVRMSPEAQADGSIPVGASKYGGCPDLPEGIDWFRNEDTDAPLSFVCQINLAEAHPFDEEQQLPASGMLYLFYDCSEDGMPWGFDPKDASGWKVCYHDGDASGLVRQQPPADLAENSMLFGSARVTFAPHWELPELESAAGQSVELSDDEEESYWDMVDDEEGPCHKLLGHANPIQNAMEEECDLVTQGLYLGDPSGYEEAEKRNLRRDPARWVLLMQIDSEDDLNMMWGDCGRLYLWITKEDLAARRFDRVWLILQCG